MCLSETEFSAFDQIIFFLLQVAMVVLLNWLPIKKLWFANEIQQVVNS